MSTDKPAPTPLKYVPIPAEGAAIATELADATPQIKTAWLDRIPAAYRHFLIMGISAGLADAGHSISALHLTSREALAAGLALTFATEYFTPLTRQFGVGK